MVGFGSVCGALGPKFLQFFSAFLKGRRGGQGFGHQFWDVNGFTVAGSLFGSRLRRVARLRLPA